MHVRKRREDQNLQFTTPSRGTMGIRGGMVLGRYLLWNTKLLADLKSSLCCPENLQKFGPIPYLD